jgi:hypothetical protein
MRKWLDGFGFGQSLRNRGGDESLFGMYQRCRRVLEVVVFG